MNKNARDSDNGGRDDPETDTYHALYHPDEPRSLSGVVIDLVSTATGQEPDTIPPLYETIDPDALDTLFQSRENQTGRIEFEYCGCEVTITNNSKVLVTCLEADE